METIFALATPMGISGVAVFRLSGNSALEAAESLGAVNLKPRLAALRRLIHPTTQELLDEALVIYFPAPHSFTGETVIELQVHGSLAVLEATIETLASLKGVRLAEQGEFTKRALMNGRLDLTQVEALADLLAAQSSAQRKQSLAHLGGAFSNQVKRLREEVLTLLTLVEATLDFPDEGDVTEAPLQAAKARTDILLITLEQWLSEAKHGLRVRDGVTVALVGAPNAGKSSLLNWFAQSDVAIVSPIAGTTRDALITEISLDGALVRLVDTAGLRESEDEIEQEGVRRSKLWMERADLILHLVDGVSPQFVEIEGDAPSWVVNTKADLFLRDVSRETSRITGGGSVNTPFTISTKTGEGCEALQDALKAYLKGFIGGEGALITRERHLTLIKTVQSHFQNALALDYNLDGDRVAEELRLALTAIGKITGHVGVEDMLDKLFREFCIGK